MKRGIACKTLCSCHVSFTSLHTRNRDYARAARQIKCDILIRRMRFPARSAHRCARYVEPYGREKRKRVDRVLIFRINENVRIRDIDLRPTNFNSARRFARAKPRNYRRAPRTAYARVRGRIFEWIYRRNGGIFFFIRGTIFKG